MPSLPKQKGPKRRHGGSTAALITDPRFAKIQTDPRFRLPSKKHTHVKLDRRFANILKDEDFSKKANVDRYGRKVEKGAGRKELERLYELEDGKGDDNDGFEDFGSEDDLGPADESGEEDEVVLQELERADREYDPAREGGFSESSSDEESSEEEDEDEEVEDAELYPDQEGSTGVPMGEETRRLACVNLDWENIRAEDLMAVSKSFVSNEGGIEKITVYPSEFGRERMKREEKEGPPRELFRKRKKKKAHAEEDLSSSEEEEQIKKELLQEDEGEDYDSSALRRYQVDKLRYYYAVIECSSKEIAKALYEVMDGREYLTSANFFDLRFIPDEVRFDGDAPRDSCNEVPEDYRPSEFVTEALRHSKVKLTWDADDNRRKEVQKRAFSRKELDDNEMQAYIGSGSSSEYEEEEELLDEENGDADTMSVVSKATTRAERREQLRAALGLPPEPVKPSKKSRNDREPVGGIQISFTPGLSASEPKKGAVFENKPPAEETTREKYIRKEKERKQKRRERLQAQRDGRDPDAILSEDDSPADIDEPFEGADDDDDDPFNDPFFTDPTAAKKEAQKSRKAEKARLRAEREAEEAAAANERAELELLLEDESNMRHFDMKEIQKAEKIAKKKKKKAKGKNVSFEVPDDGFKMDVQDPRFSRLFESHDFAIDPTHPRFKDTKGMKQLLEESRKKRTGNDNGIDVLKAKAKRRRDEIDGGEEDLKSLVEKVKKKVKR